MTRGDCRGWRPRLMRPARLPTLTACSLAERSKATGHCSRAKNFSAVEVPIALCKIRLKRELSPSTPRRQHNSTALVHDQCECNIRVQCATPNKLLLGCKHPCSHLVIRIRNAARPKLPTAHPATKLQKHSTLGNTGIAAVRAPEEQA